MSDIPWLLGKILERNTPATQEFDTTMKRLKAKFDALPPAVAALAIFALGSATAVSSILVYKRFGQRIRNSEWVTPKLLTRKRWLKGVVTRWVRVQLGNLISTYECEVSGTRTISDSSIHLPLEATLGLWNSGVYRRHRKVQCNYCFSHPGLLKGAIDLKNETLHIRIAGVDAPEVLALLLPRHIFPPECRHLIIQGRTLWKAGPALCCRKFGLASRTYPRKEGLCQIIKEGSIFSYSKC